MLRAGAVIKNCLSRPILQAQSRQEFGAEEQAQHKGTESDGDEARAEGSLSCGVRGHPWGGDRGGTRAGDNRGTPGAAGTGAAPGTQSRAMEFKYTIYINTPLYNIYSI